MSETCEWCRAEGAKGDAGEPALVCGWHVQKLQERLAAEEAEHAALKQQVREFLLSCNMNHSTRQRRKDWDALWKLVGA